MRGEPKTHAAGCPAVTAEAVERQARRSFEDLVGFCRQDGRPFRPFEADLLRRLLALGCLLLRLFLTSRRDRLGGPDPAPPKGYRRGDPQAERTLKTVFGPVTYTRAQVTRKKGGQGYHPLDVALGLTRDRFSPWVIGFVTRLATRM